MGEEIVRRKSGISIKYNVLDYCCKVAVSRLRFFFKLSKAYPICIYIYIVMRVLQQTHTMYINTEH
jgi:hypothetical protein